MTRFDPYSPVGIRRLRDEFDRLLENVMESVAPWTPWGIVGEVAYPPINVWEDAQNLYVEAELPGLTLSEVEVEVRGNELTIRGERKNGKDNGRSYHRRERPSGSFTRALRLPVQVDAGKVEASLKAGVLLIRLPKAEAAKARKIEVKAS